MAVTNILSEKYFVLQEKKVQLFDRFWHTFQALQTIKDVCNFVH